MPEGLEEESQHLGGTARDGQKVGIGVGPAAHVGMPSSLQVCQDYRAKLTGADVVREELELQS